MDRFSKGLYKQGVNIVYGMPCDRSMQELGVTREDIIAFIKRAKTKKSSLKLDGSKNQNAPVSKPVLPDDAPIAVVLFAGGGGIEAGMVNSGIRPVIAVECDPNKPELSRALAQNHDHNFSEYGCKIIQQTVQAVEHRYRSQIICDRQRNWRVRHRYEGKIAFLLQILLLNTHKFYIFVAGRPHHVNKQSIFSTELKVMSLIIAYCENFRRRRSPPFA